MLVIGLTGGIGSGKTAVSDRFAALGAQVIDTDVLAHELTGPGAAGSQAIAASFGADMLTADGHLDRARMRELVFREPRARRQLQDLLHPLIRARAAQALQTAQGPYALLVVPLLAESPHFQALCQRILLVDCSEEVQIARVMQRSGLTRAEVQAIMAAQASRSERQALADDIIDNSGMPEMLDAQVQRLHRYYFQLAQLP